MLFPGGTGILPVWNRHPACVEQASCLCGTVSVEGLSEIVQRLLRVQIENSPAIEVIKRFDSEETLFYCDPPYPHDSRTDKKAYGYEMTDEEHRKLAEVLHSVQGKVAISGYHCQLFDTLYQDWYYIDAPAKKSSFDQYS